MELFNDKEKLTLSDWLVIGGVGLLIKSGIDKAREEREEKEKEYQQIMEELKENEIEQERKRVINNVRKDIICNYNEAVSFEDFERISKNIGSKINRIKDIKIDNGIITCIVISQTGASEWQFSVDFNNWGHITGTHWTYTENFDSSIPEHYGDLVAKEIKNIIEEKNIKLLNLSYEIDMNTTIGLDAELKYYEKNKFIKKILKKQKRIKLNYNLKELIREHYYPVFSIFKNAGLKNIKTIPIFDIDSNSIDLLFKVNKIFIDGIDSTTTTNEICEHSEVIITYHDKKKINVPYNNNFFKGKQVFEIQKLLKELGFSEIKTVQVPDVVLGLFVKENTIQKVLINDENISIKEKYFFDDKITIYYHTNRFYGDKNERILNK